MAKTSHGLGFYNRNDENREKNENINKNNNINDNEMCIRDSNSFYHETKILSEENQAQKESYIRLLQLTKRVLETSIDLLGFEAPDKM